MPALDLYLPPKAYATWRARVPRRPLTASIGLIARWIERTRQRRALAGLDEHELRDIGITRADAVREAAKPFWR